MPKISDKEVERLAKLARIGLSAEEVTSLAKELDQIVEFVEELQSVETDGVEPTSQVTGLTDVWREDEPKPSRVSQTELFKNLPAEQDGYIKVRRVL